MTTNRLAFALLISAAAVARAGPPATRPATEPVRTLIVVDGVTHRVRGPVCHVATDDDGKTLVNGRPLAEVLDDEPATTKPATRP